MSVKTKPKQKKRYLMRSIVFPPEMLAELEKLADSEHRSFSAQIVHLVERSMRMPA
jgi:hypothetical protein